MTAPTGRTYGFSDIYLAGDAIFLFGGVLFISGAVISFVTPLGGIPQIAGWILFHSTISHLLGTHIGHPGVLYTNYLGLGFLVGIIAGALCILSFIMPIGLDRSWKNLNFKERLLTLHKD
jgi:hypothetical protein